MSFRRRKIPKLVPLISLIILLVLGPIVFSLLQNAGKVEAAWYDDAYAYRQRVDITNAGTAQTDYQVSITLATSSLISAGKMQSDCDDIRITDISGKVLPIWIETEINACNTTTTKIWTKVPSIPTSGATVYVYYGNPSAANANNTSGLTTGGTITAISGYRVHTFLTSGTFTPGTSMNVETLVVAGGGGGGSDMGGGGGGGGVIYNASYAVTPQSYPISIGIGGTGAPAGQGQVRGTNGQNSVFGTLTAIGGGGGASNHDQSINPAGSGGSGGGASGGAQSPSGGSAGAGGYGGGAAGSGTTNQGYAGSFGVWAWYPGGGGGAGAVGSTNPAHGGVGFQSSINGTSYYWGGGGGGAGYSNVGGNGGNGGGGGGAVGTTTGGAGLNAGSPGGGGCTVCWAQTPGGNAGANTGGGGGGGSHYNATNNGGNGGSGIVIIRYTIASPEPSIASPTNEEKSLAPILYWKLDEGTGTTAKDSSTSNLSGIVGGAVPPTWQTEDQCISGKCLYFNGSNTANNGKVTFNETSTTKTNLTGDFSTSLWVKPTSNYYDTSEAIIRNGQGADLVYGVFYDPTNKRPYFHWYDGSFQQSNGATNSMPLNQWSHLAITRSGTNLTFYVNGKSTTTATVTTPTVAAAQFALGQTNNDAVAQDYTGYVDDVKIYAYARTAAQIKSDFKSRGTAKGTSVVAGSSRQNSDALSNGLVGYWKMDEASGTAADSSGNGNTGTWAGASSHYESGKFGNGGNFVGIDRIGIPASTVFDVQRLTISAWVYSSNYSQNGFIFEKGAVNTQYSLFFEGANLIFRNYNTSGTADNLAANSSSILGMSNSNWYHIVATYDGTKKRIFVNGVEKISADYTETLKTGLGTAQGIGSFGTSDGYNYTGKIDDLRIYNRALSPREVRDLYNWAPGPLAYYNFDEGTVGNANDISGNGYTGTNTGTSVVSGKYGKARDFNGASDYIQTPLTGTFNQITFSFWGFFDDATLNTYSRNESAFGDWNSSRVHFGTRWSVGMHWNVNNAWTEIPNTNLVYGWNHYELIYNTDTNQKLVYINSKLSKSDATNGAMVLGDFKIGNATALNYYYRGKIDDFKIYNYARNSKQIVEDMNAGHPVGGSPVGSQVGYWKMDEGYGNTLNNSGSGTANGSNSNATWTNNGKFNKALNFNGSSAIVTIPQAAGSTAPTELTISAWAKRTRTGAIEYIVDSDGDESTIMINSSDKVLCEYYNGTAILSVTSIQSITDTNWHQFSCVFNYGNFIKLYIDGKLDNSNNSPSGALGGGILSNTWIGARGNPLYYFSGTIDEVKIYRAALTEDEIKLDYNRGQAMVLGATSTEETPKSLSGLVFWVDADAPSTISQSTGVSQWNDKSGNNNNVVQATGSRQPSYVQNILNGKPVVRFTASASQTMTTSTNFASPVSVIYVARQTGSYARILSGLANNWLLGFWGGCHQQAYHEGWITSTCGSGPPSSDTNWYIQSTVETGSLSTYYENGTQIVSNANGTVGPNGLSLVGHMGGSEFSDADIAEIVVYNRALSDSERQKVEGYLANKWGLQSNLPSTATYKNTAPSMDSSSASAEYCIPGDTATCTSPIARYDFEEKSGANAYDSSGNGHDLTTYNSPTWTTGKIGASLLFNGSTQYARRTSDSAFNRTTGQELSVSTWIYPQRLSGQYQDIVVNRSASTYNWMLYQHADDGSVQLHGSAQYKSSYIPPLNTWTHIEATVDSSGNYRLYANATLVQGPISYTYNLSTPSELSIGNFGTTEYYLGKIDQVRIYNYARTPAQVAWDYNRGAPVGHWRMDECQGATAKDSSGNSNTGTITIGASGTQTAVGTCTTSGTAWYNGVTGKFNSSLNFDGTDDYGTATETQSLRQDRSWAISTWVKPTSTTAYDKIVVGKTGWHGGIIWYNSNMQFVIYTDVGTRFAISSTPTIGEWSHFVGTYETGSGAMKFYVNGKQVGTDTFSGTMLTYSSTLYFGGNPSPNYYSNVAVDDVRIFNYALTATQVKTLFNGGAAVKFGPVTGSP